MGNLKFKIDSSKKIAFIILLLFFILHSMFYTSTASAIDSSPSADIQSKLKALQAEIASRAADMKNEVSKKLFNKSYIGAIKNKDSASLTVGLKNGNGSINVNEFTEYVIKSKTLIGTAGFKNMSVNDSIAALGDIDDNGVLTAKRIVKLAKPVISKKVVLGTVSSIATTSATLKDSQGDEFTVTFDKNTTYQAGKVEAKFKDIKVNQRIITVTEKTTPQMLLAKFVYFVR